MPQPVHSGCSGEDDVAALAGDLELVETTRRQPAQFELACFRADVAGDQGTDRGEVERGIGGCGQSAHREHPGAQCGCFEEGSASRAHTPPPTATAKMCKVDSAEWPVASGRTIRAMVFAGSIGAVTR